MKYTILSTLFLFAGVAGACPDFTGSYQNKSLGGSFVVKQTGCVEVSVTQPPLSSEPGSKVSTINYVVDGKRHQVGSYFQFAYWEGDIFVTEPWSAETEGEMIGARQSWQLQTTSSQTTIFSKLTNADDNSSLGEYVYVRIN